MKRTRGVPCCRFPLPSCYAPTAHISFACIHTGGQGCNPEHEPPDSLYDDNAAGFNKTGRVGGEWISKLERFRHENKKAREERKHGNASHEEEGAHRHHSRRRRRWLQQRKEGAAPVVKVQRGVQEEEEQEGETAAGITPLGASFAKVRASSVGFNQCHVVCPF